jgi:hypothetical protein
MIDIVLMHLLRRSVELALEKAVKTGDSRTMVQPETLYKTGKGVEKNHEISTQWSLLVAVM